MKIIKTETRWVKQDKCLFNEKRKGDSTMDWDVIVLKLTCDNVIEGLATALAARNANVTESYLHDNFPLPFWSMIPTTAKKSGIIYGILTAI